MITAQFRVKGPARGPLKAFRLGPVGVLRGVAVRLFTLEARLAPLRRGLSIGGNHAMVWNTKQVAVQPSTAAN